MPAIKDAKLKAYFLAGRRGQETINMFLINVPFFIRCSLKEDQDASRKHSGLLLVSEIRRQLKIGPTLIASLNDLSYRGLHAKQ